MYGLVNKKQQKLYPHNFAYSRCVMFNASELLAEIVQVKFKTSLSRALTVLASEGSRDNTVLIAINIWHQHLTVSLENGF